MSGRLFTRLVLAGAVALASLLQPDVMRAQDSSAATPAALARAQVFLRAQRLVNDGNGAAGRALVDSLFNTTEPRSPDEAEVLFWRATLAESWDQAQRDYLRLMLEHERSRFAATAMLRLAQGEAMRGDREAALRYVERLLAEAPDAAERNDALALRARLSGVPAGDSARVDSAPRPVNTPTLPATTVPATTVPATTAPAQQPMPMTPTATPSTTAPSTSSPSGGMVWSVQIAAFPTATEAAAFAVQVRERGYDARVDGVATPFRVRFGRYNTRAAATAAMDEYKRKERSDAFLTQVPR